MCLAHQGANSGSRLAEGRSRRVYPGSLTPRGESARAARTGEFMPVRDRSPKGWRLNGGQKQISAVIHLQIVADLYRLDAPAGKNGRSAALRKRLGR